MKHKGFGVYSIGLLLITVVTIVPGYGQILAEGRSKGLDGLVIKIESPKSNYVLGQPVGLVFEVTNNTTSSIQLAGADVESGYLKIFVTSTDGKFRQYSNSTWGLGKAPKIAFGGGESLRSSTSILWNFSPRKRFSNLDKLKDTRLFSDFAFPDAGRYLVKAVLIVPGEVERRVESEAIEVNLGEPSGNDRAVWKAMKQNSEIAFFIQNGSFTTTDKQSREDLLAQIRQLVQNNPHSQVTSTLQANLEKYRLAEEKSQLALTSE